MRASVSSTSRFPNPVFAFPSVQMITYSGTSALSLFTCNNKNKYLNVSCSDETGTQTVPFSPISP